MTAEEQIALWRDRDNRYRLRKVGGIRTPLSVDEARAIMEWRSGEIARLPAHERRAAWTVLAHWSPPPIAFR